MKLKVRENCKQILTKNVAVKSKKEKRKKNFCLFFGRIYGAPICLRFYLIFRTEFCQIFCSFVLAMEFQEKMPLTFIDLYQFLSVATVNFQNETALEKVVVQYRRIETP